LSVSFVCFSTQVDPSAKFCTISAGQQAFSAHFRLAEFCYRRIFGVNTSFGDGGMGGDYGGTGDNPKISGWGIKCLISLNIFTVQKMIFNASLMLGCFYKKFKQELTLGRPHGSLFGRAILADISSV
jgi:hypothetical protein